MNRIKYFCVILLLSVFSCISYAQQDTIAERVHLPNGWSLTPLGSSLPLGDLPLNIAVSPSKKLIAVTNNGQSNQTIQLIDAVRPGILSQVVIPKSWLGLVFSGDEKYLYASG